MSARNDFKAFSISNNANVASQDNYEQDQSLQTGFPPDNIPINLLNKVLRQSSTIASVVANFIATQSGSDILDDGDVAKLTEQLSKALKQKITTEIPNASLTQKGVVQLTNVMGDSDTLAVTQKLAQEIVNSLRESINTKVPNTRKINGKALSEDITITSQDILGGQAISLGDKADLNSYKTPGIYHQEYDAHAKNGLNYPEFLAGSLVVLKSAGTVQRYFVYNSSRVYTRSQFHDNPWTPWTREYNTLNKPTAEDIGSYTKIDSDSRYIAGVRKVNGKSLSTDVTITSQDILGGQAISLGDNVNLDYCKTPGIYYQDYNAHAKNGVNYPEPLAGSLIVLKAAGVIQRYFVYNSSRVYTRSQFHDNPWTPWAQEYNSLNKPSDKAVGENTEVESDNIYVTDKEKLIQQAEHEKFQLLIKANNLVAPLQDAVDLGIATEAEKTVLLEWKKYRVMLSKVDISLAPDVEWPEQPK
ncbi:tail fiber assembly protein [Photorhabdus antumapuensis]|uniref:tail fiber assembly protein n=1 Tax=Photorhabdus antumapuensis TaxID=2862867 RepID=UPI001CEC2213|nr:tail fiber assembly protein [Photorhabdus antumapuensis]MCA6221903.1 tail fiber assembly protein [Photorhabdus antumapuensis]